MKLEAEERDEAQQINHAINGITLQQGSYKPSVYIL